MRLSFFQFVFLVVLFLILFSKNSLFLNKFTTFLNSFLRYLKKYNSTRK